MAKLTQKQYLDTKLDKPVKMMLVSRGIKAERVCYTNRDVYTFNRDYPSSYDLVYSNTPYIISTIYVF